MAIYLYQFENLLNVLVIWVVRKIFKHRSHLKKKKKLRRNLCNFIKI